MDKGALSSSPEAVSEEEMIVLHKSPRARMTTRQRKLLKAKSDKKNSSFDAIFEKKKISKDKELQILQKSNSSILTPSQKLKLMQKSIKTNKSAGELFETKSNISTTFTARKPTLNTQPEQKMKINRVFTMEFCLGASMLLLFSIMITIAVTLANNIGVPDGLRVLLPGESLTNDISLGNSVFYDVEIPAGVIASFAITESEETVDPRMKLIKRPNTVLVINDDVATDNQNAMVFFNAQEDTSLVLEIDTIAGEGSVTVEFFIVEEIVSVNQNFAKNITGDEIFLTTLSLNLGQTYEIVAFHLDFLTRDELDAAIRVRDLDGNELIEAFQSTVTEFTPRTVFTVTEGLENVILEVRQINKNIDPELRVLVRTLEDELDIDIDQTLPIIQPLFVEKPTFVELDVEENVLYSLSITHDLPQNEFYYDLEGELVGYTFPNKLGVPIFYDNGVEVVFFSTEVIPGVSCRVYDTQTNEVLVRNRTSLNILFDEIEQYAYINQTLFPQVYYDDVPFEDNGTFIEFVAPRTGKVILEVSRFNIDHFFYQDIQNLLFAFPFANFTLEIQETRVDIVDEGLVDENDLYPTCDIDQTKHTIGDGTCEQGIVLFCRNDIFPAINTSTALRSDFEIICDCAEFLCATLPGGDDVDEAVITLFNLFYGVFAALSFTGVLIYVISVSNLFFYGGFSAYIGAPTGFGTWSFVTLFMVCGVVYFSTKVVINGELNQMAQISKNFDLNRIPVPSDQFQYSYYDEIFITEIMDVNLIGSLGPDLIEGDTFLNEAAIQALPDRTFASLQRLIITNLVFSIFKDVLAVITFLDVSLVWLESTKFTSLNRAARKLRVARFKLGVRVTEVVYFFCLSLILGLVVSSNGAKYTVTQNVLMFALSLVIVVVYCIGRSRMKYYFVTSKLSSGRDQGTHSIWKLIRNVSTYVIAANLGIMLVQVYSLIKVQNFDELVAASNDPSALTVFLFQDFCMFMGQIAVFLYCFNAYWKFRNTLFEPITEYENKKEERVKPTLEETTFMDTQEINKLL